MNSNQKNAKTKTTEATIVDMQLWTKGNARETMPLSSDIREVLKQQDKCRMKFKERTKISYLTASEICMISCSGRLLIIQPLKKQAILLTATLSSYNYLEQCGFYQMNRNMLINLKYVSELWGGKERHVVINGEKVSVSRRNWQALVKILDNFNG